MPDNKQIARGNHNAQISGDGNSIVSVEELNLAITIDGTRSLSKTKIFELLNIVMRSDIPLSESYSLNPPTRIETKLVYNKAPKYVNKFRNHADDYIRIDEVMKDFPSSEDIVKKLKDLFLDTAEYEPNGDIIVGNGDEQLDIIEQKLKTIIINDQRFDSEDFCDEDVSQFCVALMEYGVSACKVLIDPENHASS